MCMVSSYNLYSEPQIQKKIRNGCGSGTGSLYRPWLTVQEFASSGRSHRTMSNKSSRILHLFSDLEFTYSCLLEWSTSVSELRERYPLLRDDVKDISDELNIPVIEYKGIQQVRFSDFLVSDDAHPLGQYAIDVRYSSDLSSNSTLEAIELQRRYWTSKKIGFYVATERNLPRVVLDNVEWLLPAEKDPLLLEDLYKQYAFLKEQCLNYSNYCLIDFSKEIDTQYGLGLGESLRTIRQLMAKRIISFDIRTPVRALSCGNLVFRDNFVELELLNAAN